MRKPEPGPHLAGQPVFCLQRSTGAVKRRTHRQCAPIMVPAKVMPRRHTGRSYEHTGAARMAAVPGACPLM